MSIGDRERKVRSDKKRDIKPTVALELKDSIYRLSYITSRPVKDVCEMLIVHALFENEEILKSFSSYFKRDVRINNTLFLGSLNNKKLPTIDSKKTERVSFRVKNEIYELLRGLGYSLDCSVSKVSGLLLYESITDKLFVEKYIEGFVDTLDKSRKRELKDLLKYIQKESDDDSYNLADLISYLVEEPIKWFLGE